jgi:hypothetical protein
MKELLKLDEIGYVFTVVGKKIHYQYLGKGAPPEYAKPLLRSIKEKRDEVLDILTSRNHQSTSVSNQRVSIEDLPDFLEEHNLSILGFYWPRNGDLVLNVEYKKNLE